MERRRDGARKATDGFKRSAAAGFSDRRFGLGGRRVSGPDRMGVLGGDADAGVLGDNGWVVSGAGVLRAVLRRGRQ